MAVHDALPVYHHVERHRIHVAAPPERALEAARATTVAEVPAAGVLLRLRGLRRATAGPVWEALQAEGFRPFDEETMVAIGKPWLLAGSLREIDDFVQFAEPGWAKLAVDLRAEEAPTGSLLLTETRVYLTDGRARRRFAAYWLVARPFSGLIRRLWLRAAKRSAEAG